MQRTGAQIVWECLVREGVDLVFGYPGGAVLPIYDELFKQDKVKHILVRHEQGAGHAAEARPSIRSKPCVTSEGMPGMDASNRPIPILRLAGLRRTFHQGHREIRVLDGTEVDRIGHRGGVRSGTGRRRSAR